MTTYPDDQGQASGAIPVKLVNTSNAFYNASGGGGGGGPPYAGTPLGYQQITSLATAATLTVPGTATFAIVGAETVDVRWRDDGTAPTASVGMILFAGTYIELAGDLSVIQFIQTAATAKLNVSYYK